MLAFTSIYLTIMIRLPFVEFWTLVDWSFYREVWVMLAIVSPSFGQQTPRLFGQILLAFGCFCELCMIMKLLSEFENWLARKFPRDVIGGYKTYGHWYLLTSECPQAASVGDY